MATMTMTMTTTFVLLAALLARWLVALHPHSGQGVPPMHGDFEAQRHWMEITWHLPVADWYRTTPVNDLQYWGLDYPPLTAYVSWVFGAIAHAIDPSWVALTTSRGNEDPALKLYMRATVILCDLVVYIPAAVYFVSVFQRRRGPLASFEQATLLGALLLQPPLLLIDHGHFQYNGVMLGLAVAGCALILDGHRLLGSVAFCLCLAFKQMGLYYAPVFFAFLLGESLHRFRTWPSRIGYVALLGTVVIATFALCFAPFLSVDGLATVLHRVFPFERGLFEDKVANFWCALSVVVKLKHHLTHTQLARLCLGTTAVALLPSAWDLGRRPTLPRLLYALFNISLTFFLFSFQVHEKSILLATVPAALLLLDHPDVAAWFMAIATFSMYPLLKRDGLGLAYIATMLAWLLAWRWLPRRRVSPQTPAWLAHLVTVAMWISAAGVIIVHSLDAFTTPPARFPDLYTIGNVLVSCGTFFVCLLYFSVHQLRAAI